MEGPCHVQLGNNVMDDFIPYTRQYVGGKQAEYCTGNSRFHVSGDKSRCLAAYAFDIRK